MMKHEFIKLDKDTARSVKWKLDQIESCLRSAFGEAHAGETKKLSYSLDTLRDCWRDIVGACLLAEVMNGDKTTPPGYESAARDSAKYTA